MAEIPAGAIPVGSVQPDAPIPQDMVQSEAPNMGMQQVPTGAIPAGAIPVGSVQTDEEKFGTPEQTAIAALEGAGRGLVGPLATLAERAVGVPAEDISGRTATHPYISTASEIGGLTAGMLLGKGLPRIMGAAGEAMLAATKLSKPATWAARVGSEVVSSAAEMAVYQGSDEINKYILGEPVSVQSAIANVGLASALGGVTGGFLTGVVSPLWRATAAPKVEEFLNALKSHANGPLQKILPAIPEARFMKLTHYSAEPRQFIDPAFAGTGVDVGVKGRDLENKLAHFYMEGSPAEQIVTTKMPVKHQVLLDLDKNPLYDWANDPENIRQMVMDKNGGAFNMDDAIKIMKERKYAGIHILGSEQNPGQVALFKRQKVNAINDVPINTARDNLPPNFSMISAQTGPEFNADAHEALRTALQTKGFKVSDLEGNYGGAPEKSFLVEHSGSAADQNTISQLGKEYNQESVLHSNTRSEGRFNALRYSDDRPSLTGYGSIENSKATENFSESPDFGKFQLEFNQTPKSHEEVKQLKRAQIKEKSLQAADRIKWETTHLGTESAYDSVNDPNSELNQAISTLGIEASPLMRAAMSRDPKAVQLFNELREAQHPEVIANLKALPEQVSQHVAQSVGVPLEEAAEYSKVEAGNDLLSSFNKEYNAKYSPVAKELQERNLKAAGYAIPKDATRDFGGNIVERGMAEFGSDSPYFPLYEHYAARVANKDTIGGLDQIKTELFNKASSLSVDNNEKHALRSIRRMIGDFQEEQIENKYIVNAAHNPAELIAQRRAANEAYKNFADMSDQLADHLGIGRFKGAETLKERIAGVSGEQLVDKFSPKGNVASIPFLQQYFPETLAKVREIEAKKFLSPAIQTDQGNAVLNVGKLNRMLENTKKGAPEYANFVLPQNAQKNLAAAKTIMDSIPGIKSSGTAGWMTKMMKHVPASALSMVGLLMGHNPIAGYLLGELAERMGRDIPDAMKLSYLKYLGADKATSAEGFHSMFNMISSIQRGESKILNGAKNVFKAGSLVVSKDNMSSMRDQKRLDQIVTNTMDDPNHVMQKLQQSTLSHYMPDHQTQAVQTVGQQIQYLQNLKPKPFQSSPLDRPVEPSKAQTARYNRALDIANNPMIVMQRVKDGTVQASDLQDLQNLYPSVYQRMIHAITNEMTLHVHDDKPIPYKTRIGISLFLGQPMDTTMTAESIIAAQPKPVAPPQQQQPGGNKGSKTTSKLGKEDKAYMTQDQAAEKRSAVRD